MTRSHRTAHRAVATALLTILGVSALAGCSKDGAKSSSGSAISAFSASSAATGAAGAAGADSADSAAKPAAAPIVATPGVVSTAQVKTAQLTVAAKNVTTAATTAIGFATAAAGGVSGDTRTAATPDDPNGARADLTLKVAPNQLEVVLAELDTLGTERSRQSSSEDVTGQVADVTSRVTSAQASIARLQALFSHASAVGDIVAIEGQLAQREADLESLQAQQRALSAQTSFATITLTLVALTAPVLKPPSPDRGGFTGGVRNGWQAFTRAVGWALTGIGTALPFAILVLLVIVGGLLWRRHRNPGPAPSQPSADPVVASGPGVLEQ
jgi:hypothetical protein